MGRKRIIADKLYPLGGLGYSIYKCLNYLYDSFERRGGDVVTTKRKYQGLFGRPLDLRNPRTLNEKILWLKLNDRRPIHTLCADKYTVRSFIREHFGEKFLIPLLFETSDWKDITMENIPAVPCIVKASHSQGDMMIVRDKHSLDIQKLRYDCRIWLCRNLWRETQEWQYKNCKPRIIIEELLQDKEGRIPNDYKLHFFNGKLEFVYCSVGRETVNKRNIYDAEWNPLYFSWVEPEKDASNIRGAEILPPESFPEMKRLGAEIAKLFDYVRVDFYDVDGRLYFGEITFHHGSGFDVFVPEEYDLIMGEKLHLSGLA